MNSRQTAYERDAAGLCIVCGEQTNDRRRGLCVKDYTRYRTALQRIPENQRQDFEDQLVAEGLLMPSRQGKRAVSDDVFAEAAAEFLGLPSADTVEHVAKKAARKPADQAAAELAQQAGQIQPERKPPGRKRKRKA